MNITSNCVVAGVRATAEDEELIRFRGKPNEGLVRFRHTGGEYRRVKLDLDDAAVLAETMARCNREFGDPTLRVAGPATPKRGKA